MDICDIAIKYDFFSYKDITAYYVKGITEPL